jgi:dCMP deaminase
MNHWGQRFLGLAQHIAGWSKDPSTKVGAVIADPDHRIVSVGFNGLARGVEDTDERLAVREQKYPRIVHAEMNAILFARRGLVGCTLYTWPLPPCAHCAGAIIQSGLSGVVSPQPSERWVESCSIAAEMFAEAGVTLFLAPS